jgi:uncharacterized protein
VNDQKPISPAFPWTYFGIAYCFSWLVWLPAVFASLGYFTLPLSVFALVTIGAFGPLLAALYLTAREQGWVGLRQLWQKASNFKIKLGWLTITLLLPLILTGAAFFLHGSTGNTTPALSLLASPLLIAPMFVFLFFLGGSFQEELGWRGYALVRLQRRRSAFSASLILGVAWGLWHLPLFFINGVSQSFLPFWAFIVWMCGLSVLLTWLYNNTYSNLLVAMLFHTMVNLALALFPLIETKRGSSQTAFIYLTLFTAVVAGFVTMRWGANRLSDG